MRLLRCDLSDDLTPWLEEFDSDIPPYAILSHRWGKVDEEISFRDLESGVDISKKGGYAKFKFCCTQAFKDGLKYAWVDTCCIDKSSSAELSEAINSMYGWYMRSQVCYAYLEDVTSPVWGKELVEVRKTPEDHRFSFQESEWFTRGWTLQELIAPGDVRFYDHYWSFIGDKHSMAGLISEITRIDIDVLREGVKPTNVAQRMSWAAGRRTTRVEDRAYSLMGLFGVNMPPLYGEGYRAFVRLQEEIMRQTFDHSLFAWRNDLDKGGLLAESPDQFSDAGNIISVSYNKYAVQFQNGNPNPEYAQTNFGTRIQLPLEPLNGDRDGTYRVYKAYLACTLQTSGPGHNGLLYIYLRHSPGAGTDTYTRFGIWGAEFERYPEPSNVEIKHIYVSCSLSGFFEPEHIPMFVVDFQVDSDDFLDQEDAKRMLTYHYGAVLKRCRPRQCVSKFSVQFEKDDDDSVISVWIGEFRHTARSDIVWVFAVLGFHENRIWTDIYFEELKTGWMNMDRHLNLRALYQDPNSKWDLARKKHHPSTVRQEVGWWKGQPMQMRACIAVKEWGFGARETLHKAEVSFTVTPETLEGENALENMKKKMFGS